MRIQYLSLMGVLVAAGCDGISGSGSSTGAQGGPQGGAQAGTVCPASPGPGLLPNALCLCEGFGEVGNVFVNPGENGEPGSIGVNGDAAVVANTSVSGSWITSGSLNVIGNAVVGRDLTVGGDLFGVGNLKVNGMASVGGQNLIVGFPWSQISPGAKPADPCPCDPGQFLDVKAKVEAAKTANDNAALGLPTSMAQIGISGLTLTTGSYYFEDVSAVGLFGVRIEGAVALHLDGNLESIGVDAIQIAPGGSLDLYVSGQVHTVGLVLAGVGVAPSAFRLYVGGTDPVALSVGNQVFNGSIYAPTANIAYVGNTVVRGGLFAKALSGVGNLVIMSARPVHPDPSVCAPPAGGTGGQAGGTGQPASPAPVDTPVIN